MNLHPGVVTALRRLGADELGIARLMAEGALISPQKYHNVTLYNIRITGTGFSYRPSLDEWVYRKPENYLTPDFLARCNGLAVIMHHPEKSLLNSKEYDQRNVGSVMLPYIKGDDVWAIVKIYNDEAIDLLNSEQMSTSPAVLLDKAVKVRIEGSDDPEIEGKNLLIEGEPKLLDHIAICRNGVWDKGEGPTGVESNIRNDSIMAEKEEEDKARKDAAEEKERMDMKRMDEVADKLLAGIDSIRKDMAECNKRMDAFEKGEGTEAERLAADKARKDAEEKEEKERKDSEEKDKEKEKMDAARADSIDELKKTLDSQSKMIEALTALVRQPIPDNFKIELTKAQARADEVMIQFGDRAPEPLVGETPMTFRRRIAGNLAKYSNRWKGKKLDSMDDETFAEVEKDIYADSLTQARKPNDIPSGKMREVRKVLPSGHVMTEFFANDASFVTAFTRAGRKTGFRNLFTGR